MAKTIFPLPADLENKLLQIEKYFEDRGDFMSRQYRLKIKERMAAEVEGNPYDSWTDEELDKAIYYLSRSIDPPPELRAKMENVQQSTS